MTVGRITQLTTDSEKKVGSTVKVSPEQFVTLDNVAKEFKRLRVTAKEQRDLLAEVMRTFGTAYPHSDLLKRIRSLSEKGMIA